MKFAPGLIIFVGSMGGCLLTSPAFADATGDWNTGDEGVVVRIEACGTDTICGRIASVPGPAQRDVRNPDPAKRGQPIIGLEVLIDLKKGSNGSWVGTSYNAEIGQTFSAKVTQTGEDALEVEGCAPGGGSCGKETWTRAKN